MAQTSYVSVRSQSCCGLNRSKSQTAKFNGIHGPEYAKRVNMAAEAMLESDATLSDVAAQFNLPRDIIRNELIRRGVGKTAKERWDSKRLRVRFRSVRVTERPKVHHLLAPPWRDVFRNHPHR